MNTTQAWISFLQVQVAATGVILIAAGLAPLFAKRQIVARAWLWQCALLGVLSSLLVPLYGRIVPIRGPQLAILPAIESRSDQAIAQGSPAFATVTASTASPEALTSGPDLDKPSRIAVSALQTRSDPEVGAASPDQAVVSSEPGPSSFSSLPFNTSTPSVSSGGPAIWNRLGLAILLVWLGGMLFHLVRGIRGLIVCHRISMASIPLDHSHFDTLLTRLQRASGRKFPLPVSATSLINSPVVVGILKPQILLPVDALEWMSPAQLFQVLLHETAHVVRRDPLINAVQRITRILFWHHPLVGWMNRQLSLSREDVCDNFVLMHTEAADYAETLLEMTQRCPRLLALPGLAMLPESGSLEERVVSLLDDDRDRSLSWRRWPRLTVATALLVVPVLSGLVRVTRITTQAQEPPRVAASPADKSAKAEAIEPVPPIGVDKAADATPAASSHSGQISGKVIFDRDGSIAAAATVILLPPPPAGQNVYIGLLPLKQTTADAEGQFSFQDLPDGRYRVWANRDRQTSRVKRNGGAVVIIENGQPTTPVELKLIDGVTVTVNIADKETGKTIPDATVHLGWSDLLGDFHAAGDAPVIVSPLTPERWFFEVWAEGYAKESQWLNLENAQDAALKFQLGQGGSLEGTVVDAAGKPVDDVGVSIRHEGDRQQYGWGKTDKAGRYKFEHLPLNARLTLSVSKTDYQRQEAGVIVTQARQTLDLKILFRPDGGTVFGTVKNKEGRPVAGATLTNTGSSSDDVRETKTDSQGRYRLENLYPGVPKPSVVVRAAGFAPKRVEIEPGPAESPAEVVIALDPGHRIRGRVTDDGGRGLDDVTIYFAQGNNPFTTGGKGKTGKDGHFEFDSLPAKCKFIFQKTGYSTIDNQELALDTNRVIDVQMSEVGVIVGKVTDGATGKPIRAFNVRITFSPKRESGEPNNGLPTDLIDPGQAYQSEAGRFLLDSLVSRMPLQVMIDAEGYETGVIERVVAAPRTSASETLFRLNRIDPATLRTYRGQITRKGKPVAGVELRLIATRGRDSARRTEFPFNWQMIQSGQLTQQRIVARFLKGTSDESGQFEFRAVPRDCEVEIVWWGENAVSSRLDHVETVGEGALVQIALPEPARITGKLDRKLYPEIGNVQVSSQEPGLEIKQVPVKPDQQEFSVGNLSPGTYNVVIMSSLKRDPAFDNGYTSRPLATGIIKVEAGEEKQAQFKPTGK